MVQDEAIRGRRYRTLLTPTLFDGNDLHRTLPFTGKRHARTCFALHAGMAVYLQCLEYILSMWASTAHPTRVSRAR